MENTEAIMDYIQKANHQILLRDSKLRSIDMGNEPKQIQYSQTKRMDVPRSFLNEQFVLTEDTPDFVARAHKVMRIQVMKKMQENNWNTLAVSSPSPNEGKTLTAINLAISIAKHLDYTVLLVDLDFYRPSLHKHFGFAPEKGIEDYLLNDTPLNEIMINPGIERLVLLPTKSHVSVNSELLSSRRMLDLVHELRSRYTSRFIIFDLPPVLVGDDVMAFSSFAEATLLVAQEKKTKRKDLKHAANMLKGANLIGTVLNRSQEDIRVTQNY
jgi:capsular exopolysaccharide synthesis family protein